MVCEKFCSLLITDVIDLEPRRLKKASYLHSFIFIFTELFIIGSMYAM